MVQVNGRVISSNGCRQCDDCFSCKLPDCVASTEEIVLVEAGTAKENITEIIHKRRERSKRYKERVRRRLKSINGT